MVGFALPLKGCTHPTIAIIGLVHINVGAFS